MELTTCDESQNDEECYKYTKFSSEYDDDSIVIKSSKDPSYEKSIYVYIDKRSIPALIGFLKSVQKGAD